MDSTDTARAIPWCGPPPSPAELLGSWNFDPLLLLTLGLALVLGSLIAKRRGLFLLAWAVLVLAFVSPLCALTSALFSARAVHHLLLVSLAAPLLALSLPAGPRLNRVLPAPLALLLTAIGLLLWHVPAVYSAAWDNASVYWLMQAALLLPGWAFWSALFAEAEATPETPLVNALLIGALAAVMGLIGAVLTFAPGLLYPEHLLGPLAWGIDPLSDQQTAGLVMWVPGLVPLAALAALQARRAWQLGLAA